MKAKDYIILHTNMGSEVHPKKSEIPCNGTYFSNTAVPLSIVKR